MHGQKLHSLGKIFREGYKANKAALYEVPEALLLEHAFYNSLESLTKKEADVTNNLQLADNKPVGFQEEDWPDTAITNSGEEVYIAGEVTALTEDQEIKEHELNSILSNAHVSETGVEETGRVPCRPASPFLF